MTKKVPPRLSALTPNKVTGVRVKNTRARRREIGLTKRQVFLIFVLLIFLTGSSIGYVWSNFERTQVSYSLSELKRDELKLRELNKKLRLELATLKATQHLETMAMAKLGLRQPSPSQIVVLP
ncbi:MAG: hypothetical protein C4582_07115 [Desulfobacteraceae bacterium]|jgi:cell division protein FtsL|nr:MAG: hypothetical protein C4582_07115 [Desulfobacteraceae bacterium]